MSDLPSVAGDRGRRICLLGPHLASDQQDSSTSEVVKQKQKCMRCCIVWGVWWSSTDLEVQQHHCPGCPLESGWPTDDAGDCLFCSIV